MKKNLSAIPKIAIFFIGWAVLSGIGEIPAENPAFWRLGAETLPLLYVIAFSLVFWLIEKRRFPIITFEKPLPNLLVGLLSGGGWIGCSIGLVCAAGCVRFTGQNDVPDLFIWLLACFLNVVMQELLVRGYIYQLLKADFNMAIALIVTTALFAVMHGGAFEAGVIAVLDVVTMSIAMTFAMEATGSLLAPMLMHAVWNGVGAILFNCVSLADDYPHLYNAIFQGNSLISGGKYGIENSVVVLAVNMVLSLVFITWMRKKQKKS